MIALSCSGSDYLSSLPGARYIDNSFNASVDDAVKPDKSFMYTWTIPVESAPTTDDPSCITCAYPSHVDPVREISNGLLGPLLVWKHV